MNAGVCYKYLNTFSYIGSFFLLCTIFIPQSEELNLQHLLLSKSSTGLFLLAIFIAYYKNYKFDIIDLFIFTVYIYLIFVNTTIPIFKPDAYIVQIFFVLYFTCRIIFYKIYSKHSLICLLSFIAILQSLVGIGQLLGILAPRHTLFPVTGTFLNPGPFGCFLSIIGVIIFLYIVSTYSLFIKCQLSNNWYNKKSTFFRVSYIISIIAFIFITIMLLLSGSRSALLGFIIPIMIFSLTNKCSWSRFNNSNYKKILLFIMLSAIFIIIGIVYHIRPESANGRLHIWLVSLYEFDNSKIIGTGFGTFPRQYIIAQEKFYSINGIESKWVKYADTPYYAFNEYLNIIYEVGIIGLILFILIISFVVSKQLSSKNNWIFAYGIISLLIISFTSYPLHLIPISIILVILMSARECYSKMFIPNNLSLVILSFIFILTMSKMPDYISTVKTSIEWIENKHYSQFSIIDTREDCDFEEYYNSLKYNDHFMLDYAIFLKNKKRYSKSIDILKKGYEISNNPEFALQLANINADLGNKSQAEWYYIKAFKMVPNRLTPLYKLAILYYKTSQYTKFRCLANRIAKFIPKVKSVHTDKMKKDISDLLDILNEELLDKQPYKQDKREEI